MTPPAFAKIVVGVDGRSGDEDALALARVLAGADAELLRAEVVCVAEGLSAVAAREGADLIVVGACARSAPGRMFIGADVERLMHVAPGPVAVAPRDYARAGGDVARIGVGLSESPEGSYTARLAAAMRERFEARLDVVEWLPQPTDVGTPARRLRDLGERCQLMVVGARPHTTFSHVLFPSMSDELAHDLPCPLVAVPCRPAPMRATTP